MEWTVHGARRVYDSEWVGLELVDVELPSGARFEHHVVRVPRQSVVMCAVEADRGVLMIHRHRFISRRWGWELPAGWAEVGEDPQAGAERELLEETGWRAGTTGAGPSYQGVIGLSDHRFNSFWTTGCTDEGDPSDTDEASRIEWIDFDRAQRMIDAGDIDDGISLTALMWVLMRRPDLTV